MPLNSDHHKGLPHGIRQFIRTHPIRHPIPGGFP